MWKALFFFSQIQPTVLSIYVFFGKKMGGQHCIWRALSRSETKVSSNWTEEFPFICLHCRWQKYLRPNVTFIVLVWKALFFFSQIQPVVLSIYGFFGKKMGGHRIWGALSRSETKASSNWTPHLKQDFRAFRTSPENIRHPHTWVWIRFKEPYWVLEKLYR